MRKKHDYLTGLTKITLIIVVFLSCFREQAFSQSDAGVLKVIDFFNLVLSKPNAVIIDVQTEEYYVKNHIKNSVNAYKKEILLQICDTLCKDDTLFLYCTYGKRSEECGTFLKQNGFTNVFSLQHGILSVINSSMLYNRYNNVILRNNE